MSDSLAFLLSDVSRLLRRRFDARARAIGVTRPQWRVLTTLGRHEGTNQSALAEMLEAEPITVCRMLDRLEEAGLIERRRDPEDRRAWRIYLTDRAHPLIERLRKISDALIAEIMADIPPDEMPFLVNHLQGIRGKLIQPPQGTPFLGEEVSNG